MSINDTPSEKLFHRIGLLIVKYRVWVLGFLMLGTLGLGAAAGQLRVDNSNRQWFLQGDETIERYDRFQDNFGTDKFIYFLLENDDVFTADTLEQLEALQAMLESIEYNGEPAFEEITHIGNVRYIKGDAGGIEVIALGDDLSRSSEDLEEMRRRAHERGDYVGLLISADDKATGLIAEVRLLHDDDGFHPAIIGELRTKLNSPEFSKLTLSVGGGPIIDTDMDGLTISESRLFGVLAAILNMIITLLLFRHWPGVVIPAMTVALTVLWTLGLIGLSGQPIGVVHVILPMLLLAVGVSDSVHLLSEYQKERPHSSSREEAIAITMAKVSLPCLLTSLTTAAGMLSLSLAPIPPIQSMGVFAAIGVLLAYFISMLLVPALLSYTGLKLPAQKRDESQEGWSIFLAKIARFSTRNNKAITFITAIIIVLSIAGASQLVVETNFIDSFRKTSNTRSQAEHIDKTLGGTSSLQVTIDTGVPGGVKEPEFLAKLLQWQTWLETETDDIKSTMSIANVVTEVHEVMTDGTEGQDALPKTREAVAQELMLYENGDPDGLFRLVTDDYQVARLSLRTINGGTRSANRMIETAREKGAEIFGPTVDVQFTGISHMFVKMTENLTNGQIRSYLAAFAMILLMMIGVLKSPYLGLLSMIPNLLPIIITLGLMGALQINLDFITLLIACIAIGIAVDDTIHFLVRFKRELESTGDYETASRHTLQSAGRAMLFTTLILCGGFLVFIPSSMISIALFGALVALTVALALLSDFFVTPALLALLRPINTENSKGDTLEGCTAVATEPS
ncbi:MAG: MMPL family transporter [Myxococcota bacterium]|nr:MMPL family transporter [Myxococcota bacterium]